MLHDECRALEYTTGRILGDACESRVCALPISCVSLPVPPFDPSMLIILTVAF